MLDRIDQLKAQLDALRPLSAAKSAALASVFEAAEVEYIYESNAIEGNTLTLAETQLVISRGLTVSGKPLKDHLEATNHRKALDRLREMFEDQSPLNETALLDLHRLILRGINDDYAGRYRDVAVRIAGSRHVPPNPLKVPILMEQVFAWFAGDATKLHVVHAAADLHLRLSQVHPFIDGNGRTCRLMMNLHLLRHGYPLTIIHSAPQQRVAYYEALAEADRSQQPDAFRRFIEGCVFEALDRYLAVLRESQL